MDTNMDSGSGVRGPADMLLALGAAALCGFTAGYGCYGETM